jgi:hypothetical protein
LLPGVDNDVVPIVAAAVLVSAVAVAVSAGVAVAAAAPGAFPVVINTAPAVVA